MDKAQAPERKVERTDSMFPRLSVAEWVVFALLAGALATTNIYSTLLTGWGDGGSIIAVLAAVAMLGLLRRTATVETLNLGQTMASAGGSVGFALASYASVKLVKPDFDPPMVWMIVIFTAMGLLGTVIGMSVRRYMVRYFFPSGTACAVIQRTVTDKGPASKRPIRLMVVWSAISALATIPTKIALTKGGAALIGTVSLHVRGLGVAVEPIFYGIGIVVGPRIGIGVLLGGLAPQFIIQPLLESAGAPAPGLGDWVKWTAISMLTLPTFATILFAYVFRQPAVVPPGFAPEAVQYAPPRHRNAVFAVIGVVSTLVVAIAAQVLFDLSWVLVVLTIAVSWPLCVMNGRVTGETDINPVRLVAIVLLSLFAVLVAGDIVALLGIAIIGGTLAGMAVDMMQDFRTGYLVNANPTHQLSVQLVGTVVGALVAVPFIILLLGQMAIGPGSSLPAPGAQIWSAMAQALAGGFDFTRPLIIAIAVISVAGSGYAFLNVWPKTARYVPSVFGIGIGLLLGPEACIAIFLGSMIKVIVTASYTWAKSGEHKQKAATDAGNDTMLIGAAVFAASAVLSVLLIIVTSLMGWLDLGWFFMAGH